ncbi:MAG: bacterial domain protein [Gammaproteobacteria bacterium]|jgi:uncharacterized protein YraI|nr:bacterial domain protein [Gammaproteobacteria bacterium]
MRTPICVRLFGVYLLALSAAAAAQNAVTTHPADVYAGPDDSYPMVGQLDADAPVQVMGCLDDWSWCDVAFGDNRGWLYAPDLVYDYEGGYVPFYTYAPSLGVPVVQFTIGNYWDRYYHGRPWYGQRDEWEHRELRHRRPEGPPPSAGPPPRSARVERPSHGAQPEPPLRLGSAERPRRQAEQHDGARDNGQGRPEVRPPEPRAPEHVVPPDPSRENQNRSNRAERVGPPPHEEHPQGAAEPPRHEERAPPQRRQEGARHEETRPVEKQGERPNDSPH